MQRLSRTKGFTLIELMIVVLLVVVLAGLAAPSFNNVLNNRKLQSATESLVQRLRYFHSEAIKLNSDFYISFQTGSSWCYGVSTAAACDCQTANSCLVNGVETVFGNANLPNVSIATSGMGISGGIAFLTISGTRGTVATVGSMTLARDSSSTTISMNKLGRTTVCSNDLSGYSAC